MNDYILYHVAPDCVLVTESWLNADICDGLLDMFILLYVKTVLVAEVAVFVP